MDIKSAVKDLEKSAVFVEFIDENPDYYLINVFSLEEAGQANWQAGYYSKKDDKIVTFNLKPITRNPPEDVFKKESIVEELELDKVKVPLEKALHTCEKLRKKKYSAHKVAKRLVILQKKEVPFYNITFITQSFNIINIKLDATSNKIIKEFLKPAISFKK